MSLIVVLWKNVINRRQKINIFKVAIDNQYYILHTYIPGAEGALAPYEMFKKMLTKKNYYHFITNY